MKTRNASCFLAAVAATVCIGCSTSTVNSARTPKGPCYSELLPANVNPTELVRRNGPYVLRIEKPIRMIATDPVPEHYCLGSTEETLHSLVGPDIQLSDIAWYLDFLYEQVCAKQGDPSPSKNYCIANWHELGYPRCILCGGNTAFMKSALYGQLQDRWPELFIAPGSPTTGKAKIVQFLPVIVNADWNNGQSGRNTVLQPRYVVYLRYPDAGEDFQNGRPPRLGAFQGVVFDTFRADTSQSPTQVVPQTVTLSIPDGSHTLHKEPLLTTDGDRFGAILVSLLNSLPEETLQSFPLDD